MLLLLVMLVKILGLLKKWMLSVPFWVLLIFVVFIEDNCLVPQFWTVDESFNHFQVTCVRIPYTELSTEYCTAFEQSCGVDSKMSNLTKEQKRLVSSLYKNGRKLVNSKSHVDFLDECSKQKVIPKAFKVKNFLPGNQVKNQERFNDVSQNAMTDEKQKHRKNMEEATKNLEKAKDNLKKEFSDEAVQAELTRLDKHLNKI